MLFIGNSFLFGSGSAVRFYRAATGAAVKAVIPVGESWLRAMHSGVADPNPYDGIDAGKLNLWTSGYEKIVGTIYIAISPADPRNVAIVDLEAAVTRITDCWSRASRDSPGFRRRSPRALTARN